MITAQRDLGGANDFRTMVDELGRPFVIRHLEISRQQLAAWLMPEANVPRANVLALYWETRWGRTLIDTDRQNELNLVRAKLACHEATIEMLRTRLREIEAELRGHPGMLLSANERWFNETPAHRRNADARSTTPAAWQNTR